ncbi:MAG: DUF2142 domain-containing protein [Acidimicrobiales bacterium]
MVWAVALLFTLLLSLWSFLTPLAEGPDEHAHGDLVFHLATGGPYPEYDQKVVGTAALALNLVYRPNSLTGPLTPEAAPSRADRKDFYEWGGAQPSGWKLRNQITHHPPAYYRLLSGLVRAGRFVQPGSDLASFDREWHLVRLLNVAMVAPLPLLAWAAARRLGAEQQVAVAASVVPLGVPQLIHLGSTINNDNLLVLSGAVLSVLLAGVLRGDTRRSTAVGIGAIMGLALLTKAFAIALPLWIGLVYATSAWRNRTAAARRATGLVIAGVLAALLSGWWWLGNFLRYDTPVPSVGMGGRPRAFESDPGWFSSWFASLMVRRFWGSLGWFTAPMTFGVVLVATGLALVAIIAAFLPGRWRAFASRPGARVNPIDLGAFGVVFVMLIAFVARLHETSGRNFIQGRYLFAAIVPFAVVVAVGSSRLLGRWAAPALLAGAAAMQVDAVRVALRFWWARPTAPWVGPFEPCWRGARGRSASSGPFSPLAVVVVATTLEMKRDPSSGARTGPISTALCRPRGGPDPAWSVTSRDAQDTRDSTDSYLDVHPVPPPSPRRRPQAGPAPSRSSAVTAVAGIELVGAEQAPLLARPYYLEGHPGPIVAALAHVPELLEVALPFVSVALGPSAMEARAKELAIVRTSALLECRYCVEAHTPVARDAGLTTEEVRALRGEARLEEVFIDPGESALLGWVDALALGRGPLAPELRDAVASRFGTPFLVELTMLVGATMMLNRFCTALDLPTSPDTQRRLEAEGLGWR